MRVTQSKSFPYKLQSLILGGTLQTQKRVMTMIKRSVEQSVGGVGRRGSLGRGCTARYLSANSITILLTPAPELERWRVVHTTTILLTRGQLRRRWWRAQQSTH